LSKSDLLTVIANNVNKGAITKAQIDIIKALGGGDLSFLKPYIPDAELIGTYWNTWPANNWSSGSQFSFNDNTDFKVWGRVGPSSQMPSSIQAPILTPNVSIDNVILPSNAKVRSTNYYNQSNFSFTITNNEAFTFPIYWRLETTAIVGNEINYLIYPVSGMSYVPVNGGKVTVSAIYWLPMEVCAGISTRDPDNIMVGDLER
jgi:hypothetical protein